MKSTANIKGHPLHPILVGLPITFFIATLLFDVLANIYISDSFAATAKYMNIAGIVTAILAAIPGTIDYFYTVPPKSSASQRGAIHGILNVTVLLMFVVAYFLRSNGVSPLVIILEAAGVIMLAISGWLGGTLVYRNQIGVDPRYANAGKWNEVRFNQKTGSIEVATADELATDQMKLLHVGDKRIVLAKTEKGYVAFNDACTHKGGSLAGGMMMCGKVQCPWHGSQFDVNTGAHKAGPAKTGIATYKIVEKEGKVFLVI